MNRYDKITVALCVTWVVGVLALRAWELHTLGAARLSVPCPHCGEPVALESVNATLLPRAHEPPRPELKIVRTPAPAPAHDTEKP